MAEKGDIVYCVFHCDEIIGIFVNKNDAEKCLCEFNKKYGCGNGNTGVSAWELD